MGVNEMGNLTVSGVDMVALAKEYGTPLYVMDETMIRTVCRKFRDSISRYYQGNGLVCYASKAFSCKEIYRIMKSEGIGIDAVSIGELYTAFSVDFPAEHICFHGNNKFKALLLGKDLIFRHNVFKELMTAEFRLCYRYIAALKL